MDTGTYSDDEYTPPSGPEDSMYTSFGGGMFAGSQYFTIDGGTFNNNNITNHYHLAPVGPPDFRLISMGDIDLQQELTVNENSGVIDRRLGRERNCVRRVYSAKIDGRSTNSTVAIYQGDGAEEDWRHDIQIYMSLRHPNIVQVYGTASTCAMYATIFHGDLIPIRQFVASVSPIMAVYVYACYVTEWRQACDYARPYFCKFDRVAFWVYSTVSIRCSNGRLCVDFVPQPESENTDGGSFSSIYARQSHPPINTSLDLTSQEVAAIDSLTLEEYHFICSFALSRFRSGSFSSSATILSGIVGVLPLNGRLQEGAEIATLLPMAELPFRDFWNLGGKKLDGVLVENDWTRLNTKDVCNDTLTYTVWPGDPFAWLTQANYIFSRLRITSNLENYVAVYYIEFQITIRTTREDTPPGYLFLCPTTDFQPGPSSFSWPNCPAYWSLHPSGADRLSTEEATRFGFPVIQLTTQVWGRSWDTSVYAGLRQFHQAKGFNPESQDVARHLGDPLFRLSREVNSSFAHLEQDGGDEEDQFDNGTDEGETDDEWEDAQSSVEVEQDGDKSTENSDAKEDEGPLNVYTEPRE